VNRSRQTDPHLQIYRSRRKVRSEDRLRYIGKCRFVQATITPANNTGNLFVAGMWIQGDPLHAPTSNPPN
jgi:hypothetical protein